MRRVLIALTLLTLCCIQTPARAGDYVAGELIIQLQAGATIDWLTRTLGLKVLERSAYAPVYRVSLPLLSLLNLDGLLRLLRLDPLVAAADPNLLIGFPSDTSGSPWSSAFVDRNARYAYAEQSSYSQVNYEVASYRSDGSGVTAAVLDTGISPRHDFLAAQTVPGWNFVNNNSNTDDVPDLRDNNDDGRVDEGAGHGTMVAGIIYRFAPGAKIMPVKVLDSDGSGTLWDAAEGIRYAAANGAKVLNLSFATPRQSLVMNLALNYAAAKGATVVAAAGNYNSTEMYYPAGHPKVLTVAALNLDNTKAPFSNYGVEVDVDAPGVSIASTYWDGSFAVWSGTSFAAPIVAAEAVLIRSIAPQQSADTVRSLIISTSTSVNSWNPLFKDKLGKNGAGLINIDAALSRF